MNGNIFLKHFFHSKSKKYQLNWPVALEWIFTKSITLLIRSIQWAQIKLLIYFPLPCFDALLFIPDDAI